MFRDRSDLLVYGLGAIGVVLLASVLVYGSCCKAERRTTRRQWSGYQRQGGD